MVAKQILNNCNQKFLVRFKDFNSGNQVYFGQLEELERIQDKAYRRLKERQIKDFYIENGILILWV